MFCLHPNPATFILFPACQGTPTFLGQGKTNFFMAQQPLVGQGRLIIDALRSHSDTPHSLGLLWTGDQPDAETSTWQQTTPTRHRHPCPRRDSNPQSQQAKGRRHMPKTARPPGSASKAYVNKGKLVEVYNIQRTPCKFTTIMWIEIGKLLTAVCVAHSHKDIFQNTIPALSISQG